jgi:hypothetical protein
MPKHVGVEIWNVLIKNSLLSGAFVGFLQTVLQDGRFNHQEKMFLIVCKKAN